MKKIRLENLQPGMILAKSIYTNDGRVLAKEGTSISDSLCRRLQTLELPAVYIRITAANPIPEVISEATRIDLIQYMSRLDNELRSGRPQKNLFDKKLLNNLLYEVVGNQKTLKYHSDIRLHQGYIFGHSVNVCVWAIKIALQLSYSTAKMEELAIGALLHDIGMTKIPLNILHKTTELTKGEIEKLNQHPKMGFDLLKENWNCPAVSAHVAYQHHERFNGTGYPRQLAGEDIHEYARITAVVDVFDAMTSERVYRPAHSVAETMAYLFKESGTQFDPQIVAIFQGMVDCAINE